MSKEYTNWKELSMTGDRGEIVAKRFLQDNGATEIKGIEQCLIEGYEGSRADWDIQCKINGDIYHIEVKHQPTCQNYGFWNCETVQNGKPGGIAVSKADLWYIVNPELGIGVIDAKYLKSIYNIIRKNTKITASSYRDREWFSCKGNSYQLFATKYKDVAFGWKHPITCDQMEWTKYPYEL